MKMYKEVSELHAVIKYLKTEQSIHQKDLLALGSIVDQETNEVIPLKEEYISRAKKEIDGDYHQQLFGFLTRSFGLSVDVLYESTSDSKGDSAKNTYEIIVTDQDELEKTCLRIKQTRDQVSVFSNVDESKGHKIEQLENTVWSLYTREGDDRDLSYEYGIARHVLRLGPGRQSFINNVKPLKDYRGKYRLDPTGHYLIIEMSHMASKDKDLHMFIPLGRGNIPHFCLGVYMNTGELGIGVTASTLILVKEEDPEVTPVTYDWEKNLWTENPAIDLAIIQYLEDKSLNKISIPKRGINSHSELVRWLKEQQNKKGRRDIRLRDYAGNYLLFYNRSGKIIEHGLLIEAKGGAFRATVTYISGNDRPVQYPFIGPVTRYEKIIYIELNHRDKQRKSFLQIQIGGSNVEEYECFAATITGMNSTEEDMVAFPAVIVRKAVLEDPESGTAKRQLLYEKLGKWDDNFLEVSSPRRFTIENL